MANRSRLVSLTMDGLTIVGALAALSVFAAKVIARPRDPNEPTTIADWERYRVGGRGLDTASAALVTIVEFSDFQCPYCRRADSAVQAVRSQFPNQVHVIYRHFPLSEIHPFAVSAALAAECAGAQGKFAAYHAALFAAQDSLGKISWGALALRAGIGDTVRLVRCVRDTVFSARVRQDKAAGRMLGIRGTPTFIVNNWNIGSSANRLPEFVAKAIQQRRKPAS